MRKYTVKPDAHDERDIHFAATVEAHALPKSIDLRPQMPPVVDQFNLGSCTANAIVSGLREYLLLKQLGELPVRLSRLFLYWYERFLEGTVNEDSGAMIRDGFKVLNKFGVCPETDFPYNVEDFTKKPTTKALQDAAQYKITSYHRVVGLKALKSALAAGNPVVFGFMVYDSFESDEVAKTGVVKFPEPNEQQLGGHAVIAVGYDDDKQVVIVRNSWGKDWGDKGYCYFPYSMISNRGITFDMWTGQ